MIYLDNSATTRTLKEAADVAAYYMTEKFFNPASAYSPSVDTERDMNRARTNLAQALGATADEIIYTSGGTESNNMALMGTLKAKRGMGKVIISSVEHPSMYETVRSLKGYNAMTIPVYEDGRVNLELLDRLLDNSVQFVSIMHVNNETGAINDIGRIYDMIKRKAPEAVFHCDGVQAFCKLPFDKIKADMYSISGHKFHGVKGIGALYVRKGIKFAGGQTGGGQEKNLRSGTSNMPGIMAMDKALEFYRNNQQGLIENMRNCKERLAKNLMQIPDVYINGPKFDDRINGAPHILNASFVGVRGEVLLHALEEKQIYVSTGSACSAHKKGGSRVLEMMGIKGARLEGALRFSFSPFNTIEEIDTASQFIAEKVEFLRRFKRR